MIFLDPDTGEIQCVTSFAHRREDGRNANRAVVGAFPRRSCSERVNAHLGPVVSAIMSGVVCGEHGAAPRRRRASSIKTQTHKNYHHVARPRKALTCAVRRRRSLKHPYR